MFDRVAESIVLYKQKAGKRSDLRLWYFKNILRWERVDIPTEQLRFIGNKSDRSSVFFTLTEIFEMCDGGISILSLWCAENCTGKWWLEPASTFQFEKSKDAIHFKLRWL